MRRLLKVAAFFGLLFTTVPAWADSTVHGLATSSTSPLPAGSCFYVDQGPGTDTKLCSGYAAAIGALTVSNNLSDLGSASTARTNLGLGTAATQNTGTSGATLGLLNGNLTLSGTDNFTGTFEIGGDSLSLGGNTTLPAAPGSTQCLHMSSGGAITTTGSDCGSGGAVSLSSGNTNTLVVSPNPITSTGTITPTSTSADCSGGTGACTGGAIVTGLNGDVLYLGGGNTYTLAQAGTTGFLAGWAVSVINVSTSGNATITTTTSTFKGGSNSTTLVIPPGAFAYLVSDGTNWGTNLSPVKPSEMQFSWGPSQNLSTDPITVGVVAVARTITSVTCRVDTAVGGTATIDVYIAPSGTALGSGTKVTTTSCNANGTANTSQTGLASSTVAVPAGDAIGAVATGAGWAGPSSGSGNISIGYE